MAAVLALSVGGGAGFVGLSAARSAAQSVFDTQYAEFLSTRADAGDAFDSAQSALESAKTTLADSEGKVLTEDSRTALADAITAAESRVKDAAGELTATSERAEAAAFVEVGVLDSGSGLRESAATLASLSLTTVTDVSTVADQLAGPVAAVTAAMAVWQSEQDRILRERYTNHVHAVGWIPELDECKGSVDLTAHYGTPAIAEHWSCGGKNFPDEPGTIITLTGERAGTYRVDGIVMMLNQRRATVADIPHGYDLIYQTCQNGQSSTMSLTALTKLD
ncbi:hypothetical protein [Glaciihabitans tibetensis]|uniref:hypothetical protein n=1 Tax=Glaciihabitans tibetensis TaxID=1266600 RepID=UPI000D07D2E7|nr:hypothetical protein [Glaciihabitans tibetensis]